MTWIWKVGEAGVRLEWGRGAGVLLELGEAGMGLGVGKGAGVRLEWGGEQG